MPKFLFVTFCYPPTEVVGSLRAAGLTKYISRFGWDAVVLTPGVLNREKSPRVVETDYRDVPSVWKERFGLSGSKSIHEQLGLPLSSKPRSTLPHTQLIRLMKYVVSYPDEMKGWIGFAVQAIEDLGRRQRFDAIVSSSPPISAHMIARKAKKILGCPWIADFRDLWSQNLSDAWATRDPIQSVLERRTLSTADALVTVSKPWAENLRKRYPEKPIFEITNGFDPDHFDNNTKQLTPDFTITYAGLLYRGRRDPELLFQALRELFDHGVMDQEHVSVRFYGRVEPWLAAMIEQYCLQECVKVQGVIPRREVLQRQAESQLLLLLGWSDPRETGQHTGKLFEYMGAGRPILAVGGTPGVLTDTLNETGAGIHATCKEQVLEFLLRSYREFKTDGRVAYKADPSAIAKYTHSEMARRYAEALNCVTGRVHSSPRNSPIQMSSV